ncbi:MAG: hypothetical protein ABI986_08660, partial [Chloroflexota bacterium]
LFPKPTFGTITQPRTVEIPIQPKPKQYAPFVIGGLTVLVILLGILFIARALPAASAPPPAQTQSASATLAPVLIPSEAAASPAQPVGS